MGCFLKIIFQKLVIRVPSNSLTNMKFEKYAYICNFPNFVGICPRNELPKNMDFIKRGIVNLDKVSG